MKILYVHNDYAKPSGEEAASQSIVALLKEHGHEAEWHRRSSAEIANSFWGQTKALLTGVWNPCEAQAVRKHVETCNPDVVQVQNVYPLLSPSVFPAIKACGKPIVMRCPNYRLFCPNGLCYDSHDQVCEACFGGHEWHCATKHCAGGQLKSLGYAVRGWAARVSGRILNHVDMFIVQTEFQRQKFIAQGIPENKLGIVPGIMPEIAPVGKWQPGKYVTFVGRVSPEKGIDDFLECARRLPDIPFAVAGAYDGMPGIRDHAPANVSWLGFLKGDALRQAYLDSRMILVPSRWYEGFPNVIVMAMMLERPTVTTAIGATGSIIKDGVTGRLFQPGNADALTEAVEFLYRDEALCHAMGEAAHREAEQLYSRETIYKTLMDIYEQAKQHNSAR